MNSFINLNETDLAVDTCVSNRNFFCRNVVSPESTFQVDYSKSPLHGMTSFAYVFGGGEYTVTLRDYNNNMLECRPDDTGFDGVTLWDFGSVDGFIDHACPEKSGSVFLENSGNQFLYVVSFNPVDPTRVWSRNLVTESKIETKNSLSYIGIILPVIGSATINNKTKASTERPFRCESGKTYEITSCDYPLIHISSTGGVA